MCNVNLCEHGRIASIRKKYCNRNSPPHSAADCEEGHTMMGNDDNEYVVKVDKNGKHRWVKVKSAEKPKKPKKPKKSKKSSRKPKAKKPRQLSPEEIRAEYRDMQERAFGRGMDVGELGDDDESVFVYPVPIIGFEQSWAEDCGATYIGGSGGDEAQYAVPRGTYANAKKLWKEKLKEQGLKVSWPISKSYATLEKQKKRLGLGKGELDDAEELVLMASGKKKSPKKKSAKKSKKKPAKKSSRKPKAKKSKKKKTIAQIRAECKKKGLVYDRETKRCRKSKRGKKKSPAKKSKKSSRKPKAKKSKKKKTIAQIRAECKKKGLVYDRETKRCRKSKRGKKKSPAKKSKKSSRKPKAKKSKKKKKTIAQIRAECKKKGLVYDSKTKKCRKSKRGKKSGKKSPKKSGKKSKKMYAKGNKKKCGKMPKNLKILKTPKVCVKVLTGPNKDKHKYVTLAAAKDGGYNPRKL